MNKRKWLHIGTFAVLGFALIFQYQNCAPAPQAGAVTAEFDAYEPGLPVDVIDRMDTKIKFVDESLQVHNASDELTVDGLCANGQDGAMFRWQLFDESGGEIKRGFANCEQSGFQISFVSAQDMDCGERHVLKAQLGADEGGTLVIERRCAPLVNVALSEVSKAQVASTSTSCFYEGTTSGCSLVCYENEKVRLERPAAAESCGL